MTRRIVAVLRRGRRALIAVGLCHLAGYEKDDTETLLERLRSAGYRVTRLPAGWKG